MIREQLEHLLRAAADIVDDEIVVYADLHDVVEDVIRHFEAEGRTLPVPRVRPMREVA